MTDDETRIPFDEHGVENDRQRRLANELNDETLEKPAREKRNVAMHLPESLVKELDLAYRRMDLEARERADATIEKNADFYPTVIRAGLEQVDIDDVLDASDSAEGDE